MLKSYYFKTQSQIELWIWKTELAIRVLEKYSGKRCTKKKNKKTCTLFTTTDMKKIKKKQY